MKQKIDIVKLLGDFGFADLEKEQFEKMFTPKDLGISSRALHNWSENDLLMDKERAYDMNHKFSFVELIWLKIILELRGFGFPLKKIKTVKRWLVEKKTFAEILNCKTDQEIVNSFCQMSAKKYPDRALVEEAILNPSILKKIKNKKFTVLQFLLYGYFRERNNSVIVITNEGLAAPVFDGVISGALAKALDKQSYITIPVYKLILNFIEDEKNFKFIPRTEIFNKTELQILENIRSGDFKTLTIHFKNEKPVMIVAEKPVKIEKEARLSEILLKRGYEKIEVVTQNGKLSYSTITEKIIL